MWVWRNIIVHPLLVKKIETLKIFADYFDHDDSGYQNAIMLPHVSKTFTIELFLACCQRQQQQRQV